MVRPTALSFIVALTAALLGGCAAPIDPEPPTATPPRPTAAPPQPTPTPRFRGKVLEIAVLPGAQPGEVQVIGLLEAQGDISVSQVRLHLVLRSVSGDDLGEAIVPLLLDHLAPGEAAPFAVSMPGDADGAVAEVEVVAFEPAGFERAELEVEPPDVTSLEDGGLALTGVVTNLGESPISLHTLIFAGVDEQARLQSLATQTAALSRLGPGQSSPYQTRTSDAPEVVRWIEFADAVAIQTDVPQGLTIPEGPHLRVTAQGQPFVIGSLRNESEDLRVGSLLLVLRHQGQTVAVTKLDPQLPLSPGETLPFGQATFPGLSLRMLEAGIEATDLEVEALIDPGAALTGSSRRVLLELQVESFDYGGSSLFLGGSVGNPGGTSLTLPTLYAAVRTLEGELVGARWMPLESRIEPSGTLEFVLDMPLPAGTDPATLEYDLRGLALRP